MLDEHNEERQREISTLNLGIEPFEVPFVASLPETLRAYREAVGFDLRFVRAGSSESATLVESENRSVFPIGEESVKIYGFLALERDSSSSARVDWSAARALASALAAQLSENYRWRATVDSLEEELAVSAIPGEESFEKTRAAASGRLRDALRSGALALGGFCAASLYLLDDATSELSLRAVWGLPADRFLEPPRPLASARAELEALLGNAVIVRDDYMAEYWRAPEDFQCSICVPIISETTILGVAWFFSDDDRSIGPREIETLNLATGRLVDALEKDALSRRVGSLARVENER
ncbi:MAG: GAF domain-containing protein [Thermoguttaceae bacterium]|nr:GAF domain-containing protein [Thermoguttaceae bacterium]